MSYRPKNSLQKLSATQIAGRVVARAMGLLALLAAGFSNAAPAVTAPENLAPLLGGNPQSKFLITANVGYVYNFSSHWGGAGSAPTHSNGPNSLAAPSSFGYGLSLGWLPPAGLGLLVDYTGFHHAGRGAAMGGIGEDDYESSYHIITLTPHFRFSLDKEGSWGLRVGVGLGASFANATWVPHAPAATSAARSAGGSDGGGIHSGGVRSAGGAQYANQNNSLFTSGGTTDLLATGTTGHGAVDIDGACGPAATGGSSTNSWAVIADSAETASPLSCFDNNSHRRETITDISIARYLWGLGFTATDLGHITTATGGQVVAPSGNGVVATPPSSNSLLILGDAVAGPVATGVRMAWLTWLTFTPFWAVGAAPASITAAGVGSIRPLLWSTLVATTDLTKIQHILAVLKSAATAFPADRNDAGKFATSTAPVAISDQLWALLNAPTADATTKNLKQYLLAAGGTHAADTTPSLDRGSAQADVGLVIMPRVALEYDDDALHAEFTLRYFHALTGFVFHSSNGAPNQTQAAGPLALFLGAGFGVNF